MDIIVIIFFKFSFVLLYYCFDLIACTQSPDDTFAYCYSKASLVHSVACITYLINFYPNVETIILLFL